MTQNITSVSHKVERAQFKFLKKLKLIHTEILKIVNKPMHVNFMVHPFIIR